MEKDIIQSFNTRLDYGASIVKLAVAALNFSMNTNNFYIHQS